MNKNGPIIIIDDDADDRFFLDQAFTKIAYPNKIRFFSDGQEALDYMMTTEEVPFLILSDINMPKLDGFELREKLQMDARLSIKCIPYLLFSTAQSQAIVTKAYRMSVQGFFIKPISQTELETTLSTILEYWTRCTAPNDFQ